MSNNFLIFLENEIRNMEMKLIKHLDSGIDSDTDTTVYDDLKELDGKVDYVCATGTGITSNTQIFCNPDKIIDNKYSCTVDPEKYLEKIIAKENLTLEDETIEEVELDVDKIHIYKCHTCNKKTNTDLKTILNNKKCYFCSIRCFENLRI